MFLCTVAFQKGEHAIAAEGSADAFSCYVLHAWCLNIAGSKTSIML